MSLNATDIVVAYGRRTVLHGVELVAEPGRITAIVGPNGSGKSTLLKAICGDVPFEGSVTLNGTDLSTLKPWDVAARRGVLPQASTLAFPFTTIEVVRIGLTEGIGADQTARAEAALARVGLSGYEDRYYQELSGGEQQRAQLARVLAQVWEPVVAGEPRWLILDEPVSSVDIAHQLDVMEIAHGYARSGGGVLAVMHDLNLTALYADHVAVMADGRVIAAGQTTAVMTDKVLSRAYGCQLRVNAPPPPGATYLLPHSASRLQGV